MKIHEYQARELLARAGVPVPNGVVVEAAEQARGAYEKVGSGKVVVKAQVHAGGRGKAGYVKLCDSAEQVEEACRFMFGKPMVSVQTGPAGVTVRKIMIAQAVEIAHEYYLGVVLDRTKREPVVMASREGGVEIEEVARRNPAAIVKQWMHPHLGLQDFQVRALVAALGFEGEQAKQAGLVIRKLAELFVKKDCSLAEVNPLVLTKDGKVLAIDAKMNFDDNAIFRHPELQAMYDPAEENPNEIRAKKANLSYIALDGRIGCLVNGAGLAMATMDIIKLHGGEPANFLDVGGSVTKEGAIEAFRILLADEKVRAVLVNIFGGIAKCDVIAEALIAAAKEVGFRVPVVVRLEGTNVEQARKILEQAHHEIPQLISATDLTDAAQKVVAAANG
jgi:succinyl-CoA synthetase beta subunit